MSKSRGSDAGDDPHRAEVGSRPAWPGDAPRMAGLGDSSARPPIGRSPSSTFPAIAPGKSITVSHQARLHLSMIPPVPGLDAAAELLLDALGLTRAHASLAVVIEVGHERIGSAVQRAAQRRGLAVHPYLVDAESQRNEAFMQRLCQALRDAAGSLYLASASGIAPALRRKLHHATTGRRHALVLGADERLAVQSLAVDRAELEALGERLRAFCMEHTSLTVETLTGTALRVAWEATTRWHHDRARLDDAGTLLLPAGRVLVTPADVTGTLSPDAGVLLPDGELRSRGAKARLRFEGGRLVGAEGPWAERILSTARAEPNGDRVGQLVFGTNTNLLTPIGHDGQDLTMPGVYLVLGDSRPEQTGAPFCASSRVVLMMRRPDVRVGGEPLLVRGRYVRARVP
jgi:hypothetical protein